MKRHSSPMENVMHRRSMTPAKSGKTPVTRRTTATHRRIAPRRAPATPESKKPRKAVENGHASSVRHAPGQIVAVPFDDQRIILPPHLAYMVSCSPELLEEELLAIIQATPAPKAQDSSDPEEQGAVAALVSGDP